jgi:hypothetical protein
MLFAILLPAAICFAAFHFFLSPEARHQRSARKLVEITRIDELETAAFKAAFRDSLEKESISESQFHCIVDVDRKEFADLLTPGIVSHLSRDEIEAVTAFHQTTAGAKVLDAVYFLLARQIPDLQSPVQTEPAFDIDEMDAVSRWRRTPVGRKTWDLMVLVEYSNDALEANMRDRKLACVR